MPSVVGGGPAGMMLGYLLARAGIEVVVLEKHKDFFRDFRGDTIHPSTMELMYELGILDDFLKVPHDKIVKLMLSIEGNVVEGPDLSHLPVHCRYIAMMPQWDFLDFIAAQAKKYSTFKLMMNAEVTGLIEEGGRIAGVTAGTPGGENGSARRNGIRHGRAGAHRAPKRPWLEVMEFGVPIDVLWFRVPKPADDPLHFIGRVRDGQMMVTIDRGDYYQTALIIPKSAFDGIKAEGLEAFRKRIVTIVPALVESVKALDDWDKIKLLTVQINRLSRQWCRPGLLCIGDAAHAMSPAGGVGINVAIQDAVATANLLYAPLLRNNCTVDDLRRVQERREFAVRVIQGIHGFYPRQHVPQKDRDPSRAVAFPWMARKMIALFAPIIRRLAARVVGIGPRPEHIHTPEIARPVERAI